MTAHVARLADVARRRSLSQPAPALPTASPLRVLLLDDCAFDRTRLRRLLLKSGLNAEVTEAATAAGFKAAIARQSYDVCILDWCLPGVDVQSVAEWVQRSDTSRRAGLVVVTGWERDDAEQLLGSAHCDCFLHKKDLTAAKLFCAVLEATLTALAGPEERPLTDIRN